MRSGDITITEREDGGLDFKERGESGWISPTLVAALRAYFAAERMPEDVQKPDGWARADVGRFHSKSSAYAGGYSEGWDAALEAAQRPPVPEDMATAAGEAYSDYLREHGRVTKWGPDSGADFTTGFERGAQWAAAAQRPPVSPEVREALAATMREHYVGPDATPDGHGVCVCGGWVGDEMNPEDWDDHLTDAILARFPVPSQPVYDEEIE